jgi:ribosome-associated protein
MTSEEISQLIVKGMEERKAEDIVLMDLRHVKGAVTDFLSYVPVTPIHT